MNTTAKTVFMVLSSSASHSLHLASKSAKTLEYIAGCNSAENCSNHSKSSVYQECRISDFGAAGPFPEASGCRHAFQGGLVGAAKVNVANRLSDGLKFSSDNHP